MAYFRWILILAALAAWVLAGWIASHQSASPEVLGRYSIEYFAVVMFVTVCAVALSVAPLGGVYRRVYARAAKLFLLMGSTLVALLLSELVIRYLDPLGMVYYADLARYVADLIDDPDLGYAHRPGLETTHYGAKASYNSLGLRDREFGEKGADEFRVMVLGDSVAYGIGVEVEETFARRLEPLLGEWLGRPVRTLNTGVASYNTAQELASLRKFGQLSPDLVVLLITNNDVMSASLMQPRGPSPADRLVSVIGTSWLFRAVAHTFYVFNPPAMQVDRDSKSWRSSLSALEQIGAYCQARDIGFATFLWRRNPTRLTDALLSDLEAAGERGSFAVVDVMPWFEGPGLRRTRNSPVDSHPNAFGHEILAKEIAQSVLDAGLLPLR